MSYNQGKLCVIDENMEDVKIPRIAHLVGERVSMKAGRPMVD